MIRRFLHAHFAYTARFGASGKSWAESEECKGALVAPSAYYVKSPPKQFPDDKAREMVEEFIEKK